MYFRLWGVPCTLWLYTVNYLCNPYYVNQFCYRSSERACQTTYAPPRKDNVHILGLKFTISYHYPFILFPSFPLAYANVICLGLSFFPFPSVKLIKTHKNYPYCLKSRHLPEIYQIILIQALLLILWRGGSLVIYSVLEKNHARGTVRSTFFDPDFPVLK